MANLAMALPQAGFSAEILLSRHTDCPQCKDETSAKPSKTLAPLPPLRSLQQARTLLDELKRLPPRCLQLDFDVDQQSFSDMRSSVLSAGLAVLAIQAGHCMLLSARSASLPLVHWRAEFTFRAVSGLRQLQPSLTDEQVMDYLAHLTSSAGDAEPL